MCEHLHTFPAPSSPANPIGFSRLQLMHFDNTAATLAVVAESLVKVTCLQHLNNLLG